MFRLFLFYCCIGVLAGCSFNTTNDELRGILASPLALFLIMHIAALAHALKAVNIASIQGSQLGLGVYLFQFWPQTLASILGNVIAFAILLESGQLNLAAAIGIGFSVNSAADYIQPKNGRTGAIAASTGK